VSEGGGGTWWREVATLARSRACGDCFWDARWAGAGLVYLPTSGGPTTKTTKSNVISGGLRWAGENST
jgi:hypothetical protein